jgi:hypothetical protein
MECGEGEFLHGPILAQCLFDTLGRTAVAISPTKVERKTTDLRNEG